MDEIKNTEIDIHIKVNTITVNGKKTTKLFLSQIPLVNTAKKEEYTLLGWVNVQIDNIKVLERRSRFNYDTLILILYLNSYGKLRRKYVEREEFFKLEKKFGTINQIYI